MQCLYLLIEHNALAIYEKENNRYNRRYIEGNSVYEYDINHIEMEPLLSGLTEAYNLYNKSELEFIVINNEDELCTQVICENKDLKEFIKEKIELETFIHTALKKLDRNKELYISDFGVNFDGKNYKLYENKIRKQKFNLLGYTISEDEIMQYLE